MNPYRIAAPVLGLLFLAALAGVFYQTGAERRAVALADSLRTERIEARRFANQKAREAERARNEAAELIRRAESRRRVAEARADSLEARTVHLTALALQTGHRVLSSVQGFLAGDTVGDLESLIRDHLADDARVVAAYETRLKNLRSVLLAADSVSAGWQMRARFAEVALKAKTLECEICRTESNAWRRAANPSWFTRLRRSVPAMSMTALATAVLLLAI